MDLVQLDLLHAKPLQAALQLPANRCGLQAVRNSSRFVPDQAALGEYIGAVGHILDGTSDNHLRMPESIHRRRIDPGQSSFEACINNTEGTVAVFRTPPP